MFLQNLTSEKPTQRDQALAEFFNAMAMPVPKDSEYTVTTDGGIIVFLDSPACVVRIINNNHFPPVKHNNVLQPLLSKKLGEMRAEIFPGVTVPVSMTDISKLYDKLQDDNINLYDDQTLNAGYIPAETSEFKNGIPVVIDMGAIMLIENDNTRKLKSSAQKILRLLTGRKLHNVVPQNTQDSIYGEIKTAFESAWPENEGGPDSELLHTAWALCARKKEEGLLIADWQNLDAKTDYRDFKNAKNGGALYAQRWQCPIAA